MVARTVSLLTLVLGAAAQPVLHTWDFPGEVGDWQESWQNSEPLPTGTLLGQAGGPQVWNFSTGPQDRNLRTTIVPVSDGGHGESFPTAMYAERQQDLTSGATSWMYLELQVGAGRTVYGFHDPEFSADAPTVLFGQPLLDFPSPLEFGDTWSADTWFYTPISSFNARIDYGSEFSADAWGSIILPELGEQPCLRVQELTTFDISVDFGNNGNFVPYTTQYVRSYHFLCPGIGIASSLVSQQLASPPPEQFDTAAIYLRTHTTSRPPAPLAVTDLTITALPIGCRLDWSPATHAGAYRVEVSPTGMAGSWQTLVIRQEPGWVDVGARALPRRFYRVITLGQEGNSPAGPGSMYFPR